MPVQVDAVLVRERNTLISEQILHDVRPTEFGCAAQRAEPIDNPMTRKRRTLRCRQRPSDGASRTLLAQVLRDVPVGRDLTARNPVDNLPDAIEEVVVLHGCD